MRGISKCSHANHGSSDEVELEHFLANTVINTRPVACFRMDTTYEFVRHFFMNQVLHLARIFHQ